MRRSIFILLSLTITIALLLGACTSTATQPPAEEPVEEVALEAPAEEEAPVEEPAEEEMAEEMEPIKIGLYAPLTGPVAFLGEGFDLGITLAIEDLEGEIDGHPIEYSTADNKCNPTDAVNAASKLIDVDQVDAIIGGGCSSATVGALPIIAEGDRPPVSATSTNPGIYNQIGAGGSPWSFRNDPDDLIMAQGFCRIHPGKWR